MGGPASLLLWNMVYDPMVEAMEAPSYVGVMATEMGRRPPHRHHDLIPALSRDIGLRIETHQCEWAEITGATPQAVEALQWLPVCPSG